MRQISNVTHFFYSYGIFRPFYSFGQNSPLSALKDAQSYVQCISNTEKECFKVMKQYFMCKLELSH